MHVKVQAVDREQPFPYVQLGTLALCRLAEPIALASILPYAFSMTQDFGFGDQSAFYSGILVSSFSVAESLVCPLWGALSDRIGRKPVLLIGMAGTMVSILLMGLAPNFWFALAARSLGGALNGNIGVIQTIVGEVCKNPEHEPRAFAMMPIVWLLGTIIGPSIGAFAIGKVWPELPYLLPNLICAMILAVAILAGWFLLHETHPDFGAKEDIIDTLEYSVPNTPDSEDGPRGSYGTFAANDSEETLGGDFDETSSLLSKIVSHQVHPHHHGDAECHESGATFTKRVLMLIGALALFAYHSMCFDTLLPIMLQDGRPEDPSALPTGGLGFTKDQVGLIMSFNGVLALIVQIVLFPPLASYFGVFRLFQLSIIIHPLAYIIPPFIPALPVSPYWIPYIGLFVELVVRNLATIVLYPLLLILIKEAAPRPDVLGRINGVAASCGSFPRALAPPIVGYFYGLGEKNGLAGLAWWTTAFVAIAACAQLFFIRRQHSVIVEDDSDIFGHEVGEQRGLLRPKHSQQVLIAEIDSDSDSEARRRHSTVHFASPKLQPVRETTNDLN